MEKKILERTVNQTEMVKLVLFVVRVPYFHVIVSSINAANGHRKQQRHGERLVIHTNLLNYRIKNKCC